MFGFAKDLLLMGQVAGIYKDMMGDSCYAVFRKFSDSERKKIVNDAIDEVRDLHQRKFTQIDDVVLSDLILTGMLNLARKTRPFSIDALAVVSGLVSYIKFIEKHKLHVTSSVLENSTLYVLKNTPKEF